MSLALASYPETYYTATTPLPPMLPPLSEAVDTDVCIVGGGLVGCSAALELAARGYRVVLLEAQRIAWGASGRNGGQALPGTAKGHAALAAVTGEADARAIWDMTLEGQRMLRERIERHAIDCDWTSGFMTVATKPRQVRELEEDQRTYESLGYRGTQLMDRSAVREVVRSGRYHGGLYDPHGGHLHPLRYTLGLARACAEAGVRIHEGTQVTGYARSGGRVHVRARAGYSPAGVAPAGAGTGPIVELRCRHLLLAGNAYLGDLSPPLQKRIMAIGTYIVATERLGEQRCRELIANNAAVCDLNWVLDYFRCSSDHRLLFGGRVSYAGVERLEVADSMRERVQRVFPQLAGVRTEYNWGGYVDITMNRAPDFGRLADDVWYLQGFCGHGVVLSGIAGRIAAEAIAGSAERFDVFARIRHRDFPGGMLLRRPALVLAMLWYRLRDLL